MIFVVIPSLAFPQELLLSLHCSHTFHDQCIGSYAAVKKMSVWELPCPVCKTKPRGDELEQALQASAASASAGPSVMPASPPEVVHLSEDDDAIGALANLADDDGLSAITEPLANLGDDDVLMTSVCQRSRLIESLRVMTGDFSPAITSLSYTLAFQSLVSVGHVT